MFPRVVVKNRQRVMFLSVGAIERNVEPRRTVFVNAVDHNHGIRRDDAFDCVGSPARHFSIGGDFTLALRQIARWHAGTARMRIRSPTDNLDRSGIRNRVWVDRTTEGFYDTALNEANDV